MELVLEEAMDADAVLAAVRALQSSWKSRDFQGVAGLSRALLERDPGNPYGLTYLARSSVYLRDWVETARAAAALAGSKPLEAFAAARQLNRAGHKLVAARLFASLDFSGDWLDDKVSELAYQEGITFLAAGRTAVAANDLATARVLLTAATRLAPRSRDAMTLHGRLTGDVKKEALALEFNQDPEAYFKAWREVLWFKPSDVMALSRIARGSERVSPTDALEDWVKVLGADPEHETAIKKIRALSQRFDLEQLAIERLVEQGLDEHDDPLVRDLAESREAKALAANRARFEQAVQLAQEADKQHDPRRSLDAWKIVLALDPAHLVAAKKVAAAARQVGDRAELVGGLVKLLDIRGGDKDLVHRLASAALTSGQEQAVLDHLAGLGLADLSVRPVAGLHRSVLVACKSALAAGEFEDALSSFQTLERVDGQHSALEPLRPMLANRAASNAKGAERNGDLAAAVPLAEQVLQIVPDQPVALTIVARDLWRHRRFSDLIDFCRLRVKSGPEYATVRKLVDQAGARM